MPRSQIRGIIERDALACLGIDVDIVPQRNLSHDDAISTLASDIAGPNAGANKPRPAR